MFAYVARQAIFTAEKDVFAYELLFRDGKSNCFPEIEPDEATSKILTNNQLTLGVEEITAGKPAFINFHEDTLLYRFPTFLDPLNVVIEVLETVKLTDNLIKACKHINNLGYKIALDDHDFDPRWDVLLPYVHIIKIDIESVDLVANKAFIEKYKNAGVKLVAERVETESQFDACREMGFDYFQGYFFARPELVQRKNIPSSKLTMLELMSASSSSEFHFDKINKIIEKDVALSYMLLRFINNPVINKSNEISSLRHALNYMGEVEVKKFIALVALANLGESKPPELVHLSLVRAKFCELISLAKGESDNPPKGFLMGLFSLLDAMLDQSMDELMKKLPLSSDLKNALCGEQNNLRNYLGLVVAFERADWRKARALGDKMSIDQRMLHHLYNESVKWGSAMSRSIE